MIKKLLLVVALFIPTTAFSADQVFSISEFAGGVDVTDISQLDPKYSPFDGIMNVWTDEDGTMSKRRGIAKDNLTALAGNLPITRGYVYNQNDGDSYIIVYSSSSVFYSLGDGTYTALISTLNASYVPDFTTAQGNLYFSNGYDSPYKCDGATLTELTVHNSTDVEKARYIEYWRGYMLWAGVDNYRSRVYVSKVDYPDYVYQFIDINPDDGQVITGMLVTEDGKVLITKERSTYQLTELYTNELIFSQVSDTIGCLYNTSMTILKGFPVWCSHRGIEMFTGEFNPLSKPIDNTFSRLKQLNSGQKIITYDTATDWNNGTGVNTDTITVLGSIKIQDNMVYTSTNTIWGIDVTEDGQTIIGSARQGTLVKSVDGGYTWSLIPAPYAGDNTGASYVKNFAMSADGAVQVVCSDDTVSDYGLNISTDSGATWFKKYEGQQCSGANVSKNGKVILASTGASYNLRISTDMGNTFTDADVLISTDSGASYGSIEMNNLQADIAMSYDGSTMLEGFAHIVSTDFGRTWIQRLPVPYTTPLGYNSFYPMVSSDGIKMALFKGESTWASPYYKSLYVSTCTGTTWSIKVASCSAASATMSADGNTIGWVNAYENYGLYTSTDFGETYSIKYSTADNGNTFSTPLYAQAMASDGQTHIMAGSNIVMTRNGWGKTASYSTPVSTTVNFVSWGKFNVDDYQPSGSSITYCVQTSTANDNQSTRPYVPILSGQVINSSIGDYIWITSSFTRTSSAYPPKINNISILYNSGSEIPIACGESGDRLYVAVSTGRNNYNDAQFILQGDGSWTKHSGFVGAYMDFRNVPFYGSSLNGQIYQTDIDDSYYDDGGNYESYWTTKLMQGHPFYRGLYKCLWITAENSGNWNIYTNYRLDGSDGDWNERYVSLNKTTGNVYAKSAIAAGTNVRGIQYRIGNNVGGQYFKIKRLDLIYDDKWSIE